MNPFFAYLNRLKLIRRWGLMRNTVPENDMEHSMQCAMIAHGLAALARERHGRDVNPETVLSLALYHDAGEVITGDLPTPVKYSPAMRHATQHLEGEVCAEMLQLLPAALQPAIQGAMDHHVWPEHEARLVKSADRLAAWLKCRAELRYGNQEFEQAAQQVRAKLDEHMTLELRYFLDTFGPAFEMTLDSLMQGE